MKTVRTYKMTIATSWYDAEEKGLKSYEQHFTIARPGKIRNVRRTLARRGLEYFRRSISRRIKKRVPRGRIKVRFEREERAKKSEPKIRIQGSSMIFRGRNWHASPLTSKLLNYVKRHRRSTHGRR